MLEVATKYRKALLADECAADRDVGVSELGKIDYQVEVAVRASDALALLARQSFALTLLSSTLPDMSGPELVQRIRALSGPVRSIPIVLLHPATIGLPERSYDSFGIAGHVSRPIAGARLEQLLRHLTAAEGSRGRVEPIIDIDHLLSFTDGDLELEGELSTLFLSSAEAYFERMSQSLPTGTAWRSSVHALKGASANLGARRLAALAQAAEQHPPAEADLQAIRRAIDEVGAFFDARQRSHAKSLPH
jgi:CheY-like chemotaxis protein/HPt (histidine-containing phosphotransfer) domain-containing protein